MCSSCPLSHEEEKATMPVCWQLCAENHVQSIHRVYKVLSQKHHLAWLKCASEGWAPLGCWLVGWLVGWLVWSEVSWAARLVGPGTDSVTELTQLTSYSPRACTYLCIKPLLQIARELIFQGSPPCLAKGKFPFVLNPVEKPMYGRCLSYKINTHTNRENTQLLVTLKGEQTLRLTQKSFSGRCRTQYFLMLTKRNFLFGKGENPGKLIVLQFVVTAHIFMNLHCCCLLLVVVLCDNCTAHHDSASPLPMVECRLCPHTSKAAEHSPFWRLPVFSS